MLSEAPVRQVKYGFVVRSLILFGFVFGFSIAHAQENPYLPVQQVGQACLESFPSNDVYSRYLVQQVFILEPKNQAWMDQAKSLPWKSDFTYKDEQSAAQQSSQIYLNQLFYNWMEFEETYGRSSRFVEKLQSKLQPGMTALPQVKKAITTAQNVFDVEVGNIRQITSPNEIQDEIDMVNMLIDGGDVTKIENGYQTTHINGINQICQARHKTYSELKNLYLSKEYLNWSIAESGLSSKNEKLLYPNGRPSNPIQIGGLDGLIRKRMQEERELGAYEAGVYWSIISKSKLGYLFGTKTALRKEVGLFDAYACVESGRTLRRIQSQDLILPSVKDAEEKFKATAVRLAYPTQSPKTILKDFIRENPQTVMSTLASTSDVQQAKLACSLIHEIKNSQQVKETVAPVIIMAGTILTAVAGPEMAPIAQVGFNMLIVGAITVDLIHSYTMEKHLESAVLAGQMEALQANEIIHSLKNERALSYINLTLAGIGATVSIKQMMKMDAQIKAFNDKLDAQSGVTQTKFNQINKTNETPAKINKNQTAQTTFVENPNAKTTLSTAEVDALKKWINSSEISGETIISPKTTTTNTNIKTSNSNDPLSAFYDDLASDGIATLPKNKGPDLGPGSTTTIQTTTQSKITTNASLPDIKSNSSTVQNQVVLSPLKSNATSSNTMSVANVFPILPLDDQSRKNSHPRPLTILEISQEFNLDGHDALVSKLKSIARNETLSDEDSEMLCTLYKNIKNIDSKELLNILSAIWEKFKTQLDCKNSSSGRNVQVRRTGTRGPYDMGEGRRPFITPGMVRDIFAQENLDEVLNSISKSSLPQNSKKDQPYKPIEFFDLNEMNSFYLDARILLESLLAKDIITDEERKEFCEIVAQIQNDMINRMFSNYTESEQDHLTHIGNVRLLAKRVRDKHNLSCGGSDFIFGTFGYHPNDEEYFTDLFGDDVEGDELNSDVSNTANFTIPITQYINGSLTYFTPQQSKSSPSTRSSPRTGLNSPIAQEQNEPSPIEKFSNDYLHQKTQSALVIRLKSILKNGELSPDDQNLLCALLANVDDMPTDILNLLSQIWEKFKSDLNCGPGNARFLNEEHLSLLLKHEDSHFPDESAHSTIHKHLRQILQKTILTPEDKEYVCSLLKHIDQLSIETLNLVSPILEKFKDLDCSDYIHAHPINPIGGNRPGFEIDQDASENESSLTIDQKEYPEEPKDNKDDSNIGYIEYFDSRLAESHDGDDSPDIFRRQQYPNENDLFLSHLPPIIDSHSTVPYAIRAPRPGDAIEYYNEEKTLEIIKRLIVENQTDPKNFGHELCELARRGNAEAFVLAQRIGIKCSDYQLRDVYMDQSDREYATTSASLDTPDSSSSTPSENEDDPLIEIEFDHDVRTIPTSVLYTDVTAIENLPTRARTQLLGADSYPIRFLGELIEVDPKTFHELRNLSDKTANSINAALGAYDAQMGGKIRDNAIRAKMMEDKKRLQEILSGMSTLTLADVVYFKAQICSIARNGTGIFKTNAMEIVQGHDFLCEDAGLTPQQNSQSRTLDTKEIEPFLSQDANRNFMLIDIFQDQKSCTYEVAIDFKTELCSISLFGTGETKNIATKLVNAYKLNCSTVNSSSWGLQPLEFIKQSIQTEGKIQYDRLDEALGVYQKIVQAADMKEDELGFFKMLNSESPSNKLYKIRNFAYMLDEIYEYQRKYPNRITQLTNYLREFFRTKSDNLRSPLDDRNFTRNTQEIQFLPTMLPVGIAELKESLKKTPMIEAASYPTRKYMLIFDKNISQVNLRVEMENVRIDDSTVPVHHKYTIDWSTAPKIGLEGEIWLHVVDEFGNRDLIFFTHPKYTSNNGQLFFKDNFLDDQFHQLIDLISKTSSQMVATNPKHNKEFYSDFLWKNIYIAYDMGKFGFITKITWDQNDEKQSLMMSSIEAILEKMNMILKGDASSNEKRLSADTNIDPFLNTLLSTSESESFSNMISKLSGEFVDALVQLRFFLSTEDLQDDLNLSVISFVETLPANDDNNAVFKPLFHRKLSYWLPQYNGNTVWSYDEQKKFLDIFDSMKKTNPAKLKHFIQILSFESSPAEISKTINQFLRTNGQIVQSDWDMRNLLKMQDMYTKAVVPDVGEILQLQKVMHKIADVSAVLQVSHILSRMNDDLDIQALPDSKFRISKKMPYVQDYVINLRDAKRVNNVYMIPGIEQSTARMVYFELDPKAAHISLVSAPKREHVNDFESPIYLNQQKTVVMTIDEELPDFFRILDARVVHDYTDPMLYAVDPTWFKNKHVYILIDAPVTQVKDPKEPAGMEYWVLHENSHFDTINSFEGENGTIFHFASYVLPFHNN